MFTSDNNMIFQRRLLNTLPPSPSLLRRPRARPLSKSYCKAFSTEPLASIIESPYRDLACCGISIVGALMLVKGFDVLASSGMIDQVHGYCSISSA
jgi:hypothetical protein